MRRIKTPQDLEYERCRLRLLRLEQEKAIQQQWDALKLSVASMVLLRQTLNRFTDEKTKSSDWMAWLIQMGAATLGEKLGNMTAKKIETTITNAIHLGLEAWRKKEKLKSSREISFTFKA
ncbi:MAG: hypothetical protein ACKO41_00700 [Sphingomonadales bacterium]